MLRRTIICTLAVLAISACAPSGSDGDDEPSSAPFGYEFANLDEHAPSNALLYC